jgi:hypothetical protein
MLLVVCDTEAELELNFKHALLAEPLPEQLKIPSKIWEVFRAITC